MKEQCRRPAEWWDSDVGTERHESEAGDERGLADEVDDPEPLTLRFRLLVAAAAGVRTTEPGAGLIGVLNKWSSRTLTGVIDTVEDWMT